MTLTMCTWHMHHNPRSCQQLPIAEKRQGPERATGVLPTTQASLLPHCYMALLPTSGLPISDPSLRYPISFLSHGHIWEHSHGEQAGQDTGTRGYDTELGRLLCGSSHAKGRPFSMWQYMVGWRGAEQTAVMWAAAGRGSSLPTHFLCALRI